MDLNQQSSSPPAPAVQEQTLPEKSVAARFSTMAHDTHQQPGQQHFQPLGLPKVEPFAPSKPFSVAKLVLGGFNLVFAIIALGLSLGLVSTSFTFDTFIVVIIMAVTAIVSIVWQLAEFITIAARKSRRPIHPGAHVGVHLILWFLSILVVPTLFISLAYTLDDYSIEGDCGSNGGSSYSYQYCSYYTFASQAAADSYFRLMEALSAFSVLLLVAHFTLFVMACVETDRRRKHGRRTKVVYVVASTGPVDGRTYYSPVAPPRDPVAGNGAPDAGSYGYYAPAVPAPAQHHVAHGGAAQPGTAV